MKTAQKRPNHPGLTQLRFMTLVVLALFNISAQSAGARSKSTPKHFEFYKDEAGIMSIKGAPCRYVESIIDALQVWTKNLGETPGRFPDRNGDENECSYPLRGSIPQVAVELWDSRPKCDGPNCWNLTLVGAKILPALRFSDEKEFRFWLNSPICKKLTPDLKRQPGDIVRLIYQKSPEVPPTEIHSLIYVTEEVAFEKHSRQPSGGYGLRSIDWVFNEYRKWTEDTLHADLKSNNLSCLWMGSWSDDCPFFGETYHCSTLEDFLRSHQRPDTYDELNREITGIENRIAGIAAFSPPKTAPSPELTTFGTMLDQLEKQLQEEMGGIEDHPRPNGQDDLFLLRGLSLRIQSTRIQLGFLTAK